MSNSPRSNFTEIIPEEQFISFNDDNTNVVLVKHDYYSTDDSHGKFLLQKHMESLYNNENKIAAIYLVSSGVNIASDPAIIPYIEKLIINHESIVYACSESLANYGVDLTTIPLDITSISASDLFSELASVSRIIVIE